MSSSWRRASTPRFEEVTCKYPCFLQCFIKACAFQEITPIVQVYTSHRVYGSRDQLPLPSEVPTSIRPPYRGDQIKERSWKELRASLRERSHKQVAWDCAERPVICKTSRSMSLIATEFSTLNTTSTTLQQAANLAGTLATVSSHDIRHGAVLEYAQLSVGLGASAVKLAEVGLGHSPYSVSSGNTEAYIGGLLQDFWAARTALKLLISPKRSLELVHKCFKGKKLLLSIIYFAFNARLSFVAFSIYDPLQDILHILQRNSLKDDANVNGAGYSLGQA